jgi:methylmalonyl-CoA mutase
MEVQNMLQARQDSGMPDFTDELFREATRLVAEFAGNEGRNPRILLTQMGWDDRKLKAKSISVEYANLGFDVDISPRFQNPAELAKQAVENDVHFIEIYDLDPEYLIIAPEIISELRKLERDDILLIAEGSLRNQDYRYLFSNGVAAVLNPSVPVTRSVSNLLQMILHEEKPS